MTETELNKGINTLHRLLLELAKGRHLRLDPDKYPGYSYPIAMGEDGTVGFLYNEDRVVSEIPLGQLIRLCGRPDFLVIMWG